MYVIPLIVIVLLALVAVAWSPIFALVFFAIFMLGFFVFVGLRRRPEEERMEAIRQAGEKSHPEDESDTGAWGERRA